MCRMLGLAGLPSALATEALQAFYPLCTEGMVREDAKEKGHLSGWGIAGTSQGQSVYFARRPVAASEDQEAWRKAVDQASSSRSPALLAHFRKASVGGPSLENTHPFQQAEWLFCHNGTLKDHLKLPLKRLRPKGETDSERLFLHLLESMEGSSPQERKGSLQKALDRIQKSYSYHSLTFLMSDGTALYAYRSYSDEGRYYTLFTAAAEGGSLICSEPILKEKIRSWVPLSNNELAVFPILAKGSIC